MRIFRLALTSCLHAVISTRKSHKGKWAGEGGLEYHVSAINSTCGAKVARTGCRISLRTYPRTYPFFDPHRREVVNNESQVTTGGVLPRGDRKRARNFPLKVTKNELKFRKNFETSSLTVHLDCGKIEKKEKRRKRENPFPPFSIDQSIKVDSRFRKNGRMFR